MTEEDFARLDAMARITRARVDVMERALAIFMANTDRPLTEIMESQYRAAEGGTLNLGDEAAVRFADLLAQALARPR